VKGHSRGAGVHERFFNKQEDLREISIC
jgi:hypothetical protein